MAKRRRRKYKGNRRRAHLKAYGRRYSKNRRRRARRNRSIIRRIPRPLGLAVKAATVGAGIVAPNIIGGFIGSMLPLPVIANKAIALVVPPLVAGMLKFNKKTVGLLWIGSGINGLLYLLGTQGYHAPGFGANIADDYGSSLGVSYPAFAPGVASGHTDSPLGMPDRLISSLYK